MLPDVRLAARIGVEDFVYGVAFALERAFAEIQGGQIHRAVTEQRVAHDEHLVGTRVASRRQTCAVGLVSVVGAGYGIHRGGAGFHPYKLPVEIEIVGKILAAVERGVA